MDFVKIADELYQKRAFKYLDTMSWTGMSIGKVAVEHKGSYIVYGPNSEYKAEILGQLLYKADSRNDLPVVGDWVVYQTFDEGQAIIHGILPRKSIFTRTHGKKSTETQIIAANLDAVVIVMGADRDFNLNRLERYLTLCNEQSLDPILVLTKIDLLDEEAFYSTIDQLDQRINNVPIYPINTLDKSSLDLFMKSLNPGHSYCFIGSSGVGKSTLINALHHDDIMKTGSISTSVKKGKHTTTHRQLLQLPNGAIVIDNPGIREVGIGNASNVPLDQFESLDAHSCRFVNCTHTNEPGCGVLSALNEGIITQESYQNFQKLIREKEHYESTEVEKRRKGKALAGLIKKSKSLKRK